MGCEVDRARVALDGAKSADIRVQGEHLILFDDCGRVVVMSLESGPFITMMTLGGLLAFPWQTLLGAILPLAIGIALGNLDREMRDFFVLPPVCAGAAIQSFPVSDCNYRSD